MPTIRLPTAVGHLAEYRVSGPRAFPDKAESPFNRVALAAAHVVADPLADVDLWLDVAIDWERTIAYRERLWDLGLGVAEAMDTAQRGMGLDWNASRELIRRSLDAARGRPDAIIFCGAGTDHLPPLPELTIDDVIRAYEEQISAIERMGGRIVLMASRALAACARSPGDYVKVYRPDPRPAARSVHHPLAGRDVRPGARGLFWQPRPHGRDGRVRRDHRRQCRQGRRQSCPCWTRTRRSHSAPVWLRASAWTPVTTSTGWA